MTISAAKTRETPGASAVALVFESQTGPFKRDLHGVAGAGWYTQRASAERFFMPVGLPGGRDS